MATTRAVWAIDIGRCALKALRCSAGEDEGKLTVEAFDYIEYPKILSQPEADPVALVAEALQTFLSRNDVKGDRVAIGVSGQSGLSRFIKLPPVEKKKIPDIVKYEAKQQIPFALEDVVWDYQVMAGGSEEEGFALETEVGLFAMKREQVFEALRPLEEANIEVDIIQLTPLALYNYIVFDQLRDLPPPDEYDPDEPPASVVVVSIGTDSSDLVVTNGYKVWQRSIPLGGNHFTKALTKELKLTFAKAEHLKRHADQAEDPRAVYQAMRPIFSDLVTEIQRSLNYFRNLDKNSKITKAVLLGNAMKLPGLESYLAKYLGDESKGDPMEVTHVESFPNLVGPSVVGAPAFKENQFSFAVCYGLALQGTGKAKLMTNLVPKELVIDRQIRSKKPWAIAAVAALLLGCTLNFLGYYWGWWSVHPDHDYGKAFVQVKTLQTRSNTDKENYNKRIEELKAVRRIGENLVGTTEGRLDVNNLYLAIDAALPRHVPRSGETKWDVKIEDRDEIHVHGIEMQYFGKAGKHNEPLERWARETQQIREPNGGAAPSPAADAEDGQDSAPSTSAGGPKGSGWVVQITGHHFHNARTELPENVGAEFVKGRLIKKLQEGSVTVPTGKGDATEVKTMQELGISYPVLVSDVRAVKTVQLPNPNKEGNADDQSVQQFDFVLQFVWQPPSENKKAAASSEGDGPSDADVVSRD